MQKFYESLIERMARRFMLAGLYRAVENTDKFTKDYLGDHHDFDELKLKAPKVPEIEYSAQL
jgi:hypothetical protein